MNIVLPRLLLILFLFVSLEGAANLELGEPPHNETVAGDFSAAGDTSVPDDTSDDSNCCHCTHNHGAGLLEQVEAPRGLRTGLGGRPCTEALHTRSCAPPTPPPNLLT